MSNYVASKFRFSTVSSQDHGGLVYIATLLAFTYSTLAFVTRYFIKRRLFGYDDWAMTFAQVANTIQFSLLLVSLSAGLGKSFDSVHQDAYKRMALTLYSNQVVLYLSLGLSKVATVLLVQRLSARDATAFWNLCNLVTGTVVTWTILATLMVSLGCSPESTSPLIEAHTCSGILTRYQVVMGTDALTDVLLVVLPACLVWQIHMSIQLKLQVVAVFAIRLPLIPLSVLALMRFKHTLQSSNPGVDRSAAVIYQQSELCYSLIAGTLPCLKSFIQSFDTGSGVNVKFSSYPYDSHTHSRGESHPMQTLTEYGSQAGNRDQDKGDIRVSKRAFSREEQFRLRKDTSTHVTAITTSSSQELKDEDAARHGSQELIIRRDVQWEVRSEDLR